MDLRSFRYGVDRDVKAAHLMACLNDEQNHTQDTQSQVLRLNAERLNIGSRLAEMESIKRHVKSSLPSPGHSSCEDNVRGLRVALTVCVCEGFMCKSWRVETVR